MANRAAFPFCWTGLGAAGTKAGTRVPRPGALGMADDQSFAQFIRRIRAGDAQAAAQLLREYESAIRLEVRLRLRDSRLRRLFDSMDICQSVLGSFFVRAAAGEDGLDPPEERLKLRVAMRDHTA